MKKQKTPTKYYGVSLISKTKTYTDEKHEELKIKGFCVVDSGYDSTQIQKISDAFDNLIEQYKNKFKKYKLKKIDEHNTLRLPLSFGKNNIFMTLAFNKPLLALVSKAIEGKFILNQQNGIINPSRQKYNQGKWHRDLPYQHFVSSKPLALNALFCVDDFTNENGATFVLQGTHKSEKFPSQTYILNNSCQITAKKGSFIVLDCMLYHAGGNNGTLRPRRAINHVFTIPFFKQQISIPKNITQKISGFKKDILGYPFLEPASIEKYLLSRVEKK